MIKILHFIKLGDCNLNDQEIYNLESWKRCYPDFEIMYWTDSNIGDMLEDCPYIKACYHYQYYGYVSDYLRIKVTYLYGGMYMDTDVLCVNRIKDELFEKPFIPWSPEHCTLDTCTGTAIYNNKPLNPLFEKLLDRYRDLPWSDDLESFNSACINNKYIDKVFYNMGLDSKNGYLCSLEDQDLGDIVILNRAQYGYTDFRAELPCITEDIVKDKTVYLQHNYAGSWGVKNYDDFCDVTYAVIRDNTDTNELLNWVICNWSTNESKEKHWILMIFINGTKGNERDFVTHMHVLSAKDTWDMKKQATWQVVYIGDNLSKEDEDILINNYLLTKTPNMRAVEEIKLGEKTYGSK